MFEAAEIPHSIPEKRYKQEMLELRQRLLELQLRVREQGDFPVLILVNGLDAAGKGEAVNQINEWMDPRYVRTEAYGSYEDRTSRRPEMWRYWKSLPPSGLIGVLFGSWYTIPLAKRMRGKMRKSRFGQRVERIRHFERMLAAEGALIIKLWFHLSKRDQHKRLKELESDPLTAWRVTDRDWDRYKQYDRFVRVASEVVRETSTAEAPWHIVPGADANYRTLLVGELIAAAMEARLKQGAAVSSVALPPLPDVSIDSNDVLSSLDYSAALGGKKYREKLQKAQGRLNQLTRDKRMRDHSLVLVFEGMDAAGKGSTIRRITQALDARFYRIVPVAAPTDEERAQPYLWRFWRRVPETNQAVIFDRSWYGRVLVERVEGFCSEADWRRAYSEINEFEQQLTEAGAIVIKFWLSVTPEEQLRRFREREVTPHKQYKITDEDWRNRERWPLYERAICDMIQQTSSEDAPWVLVPSNDKKYARVRVIETIADRLEECFSGKD